MLPQEVKNLVSEICSDLNDAERNQVLAKLDKLGVRKLSHLQNVEESDVNPPMTTIQFRMMKRSIEEPKDAGSSKATGEDSYKTNKVGGAHVGAMRGGHIGSISGDNYGDRIGGDRIDKIEGGNYRGATFGGDNIRATNMAKIDKAEGTVNVGGHKGHDDFYFPDVVGDFDINSLVQNAKRTPKHVYDQQKNNDKIYPVITGKKGQALIANYLNGRDGARKDTEYLKKLLPFLGFEVTTIEQDQSEKGLRAKINNFLHSKAVESAPAVLLFIGSHGKQQNGVDYFVDSNQQLVQLKSIVDMFSIDSLTRKPKLFWFQICRVNHEIKSDGVVEEEFKDWYRRQFPNADATEELPPLDDVYLGFATLPENKAYRTKSGSWFVMAICVVFCGNAYKDDFETMLKKVNKEVKKKNKDEYIQMCDLKSGLRKHLHLYPKPEY